MHLLGNTCVLIQWKECQPVLNWEHGSSPLDGGHYTTLSQRYVGCGLAGNRLRVLVMLASVLPPAEFD